MGTALGSHLETEFWARQWPWCYWHISRYRFSNWNADICRHGPSVSPCFSVMLSLAQPDLFLLFFPSSAVNAVLTVSYIIWWHQRKHSYGCRLGRSRHLWQICDKLHFSAIFILSDEGSTLGKRTWTSLDGNGAMSHWTAIASALRGGDLWSLTNPSL